MRPSPPKRPISERESETLLEDLCIALRNVGVFDYDLPHSDRAVQQIDDVKAIHAELLNRGFPIQPRIQRLSEETSWQMESLLEECLGYPQTIPYVRAEDGIRRRLRCYLCRAAERPIEDTKFLICDGCLKETIQAIRARSPSSGIVLIRTYNAEKWCAHADADTVFACLDGDYDWWNGWCEICLAEERIRRGNALGGRGDG